MNIRKTIAVTALSTAMGAGAAIAGEMTSPGEPLVENDRPMENQAATFKHDETAAQDIERVDDLPLVDDQMRASEELGDIEPYRPQTAERDGSALSEEKNPTVEAK